MRRLHWLVAALLAVGVVGTASCARTDEETQKKLDQAISKLESIEKKVDSAPAARGAAGVPTQVQPGGQPGQPQRPPGPDPATVYSVDIKGDLYEGPAVAKITIVEASDFA